MKKYTFSISQKVLFAFIIVLIPILAAFFVHYNANKRNLERLLFENLRTIGDEREAYILMFLGMSRDRIQDFSTDGDIVEMTEKIAGGDSARSSALSDYLTGNKLPLLKNFHRISIYSIEGKVIASAGAPVTLSDVSGKDFFINGRKGLYITDVNAGSYPAASEMAITAPISSRKTGKVIGVIGGFVPLSNFKAIFTGGYITGLGAPATPSASFNGYKTMEIYLVNRDKRMITESLFVKDSVLRQPVDTRPVRACLAGKREVTGIYRDYRGVEVAGASTCFPSLGWTMLVEVDEKEVFAPVESAERHSIATIAVVVGLMTGLLVYFLRIVAVQLWRLAAAASEISDGNYETRIPVTSSDEVGVLSESFNTMAGALEKREQALLESEGRLNSILENTTNIVYVKDREGRHILINRRFEQLFHVKREDARGKTVHEIFPSEYADRMMENDRKAFSSRTPLEFEEEVPLDDGVHTYLSIKFPMYFSAEFPDALGGVSTDITRLKRSEEALRRSEAALANAQRIAHIGSWELDAVKNDLFVSDEIFRIFGLKATEKRPTYEEFLSFVHPEDREFVKKSLFRAGAARAPYSFDSRIITARGELKIVHMQGEILKDASGNTVRISGTLQDVTRRKMAEDKLKESERNYRALVENALVGVYRSNIKGDLLFVNDALVKIFEFDSPGEAVSKGSLVRYRNLSDRVALIKNLQEYGTVKDFEVEMVTKTGRVKNVLMNAVLFGDILMGMIIDITERKKAEEEVRTLYAELEQRVADRTAQLDAANRELEAFSYSVAHDLRTPLRLIDGFSRVLLKDYRDSLDQEGQEYIMRLRGASKRMEELIEGLLALSHVIRSDIRYDTINLSGMVKAIAVELQKTEEEREVRFIIEDGLEARGDSRLLRVALDNLVGNAWKFTGKTPEAVIEFGCAGEKNGKKVFFVRDNGAGFDMKYAERLFGAFQRLHPPTEFPGSGIGLATVHRIISRHGGEIWAEGERGKGAVFYFTLKGV